MASVPPRLPRLPRRGARSGFTLIELMVVVVLVSLLAVMATPAMLEAQRGRRAYEDAATIMMLFKNARARAIGDQAAVAITLTSAGDGTSISLFREYESTFGGTSSTGSVGSVAGGQSSMSACTQPSIWDPTVTDGTAHAVLIEGYNMNEQVDQDARVRLFVNGLPAGTVSYCFTPAGRMYSATTDTKPVFIEAWTSPVLFTVKRDDGSGSHYKGPTRNVLVMPSGATRMYST